MDHSSKIIKQGWLKKQGGLVKNWQLRYFILQDQRLRYYTNDDQVKLLGTVEVKDTKVSECSYNPEEPDRWMFEVTSAKGGKVSSHHDTFLMWANDKAERSDWISAIRRSIYKDIGGGVFGGSLHDVMLYDKEHHQCDVPHIVKQCVEMIRDDGMMVEGIFRLSGRSSLINELRRKYDQGERPNLLAEGVDIHTAASLLKLYLRELPQPVIPFEYFEAFLDLGTSFKFESNREKTFNRLKQLVMMIPPQNYTLLDYLTKFLNEVSENCAVNRMDEKNIAVCFGSNILRSEDTSPEFHMAVQNITTQVLLTLVKFHDAIFCDISSNINNEEFERLVSVSEETSDTTETAIIQPPANVVADLIDIDFSCTNTNQTSQVPVKMVPPAIPPRAAEINRNCELDNDTSLENSTINQQAPVPTPRNLHNGPVTKRACSTRKNARPAPVLQDSTSEELPSPTIQSSHDERIGQHHRERSNFQSYIDSPLDSRISLNIGDLPDNVDDLQALVLSLKLQLKECRKSTSLLQDKHKEQMNSMAETITYERQAKDDAILKVVELSNQLALYHSKFGSSIDST